MIFIAECAQGHEGSLKKIKKFITNSKKLHTKYLKFHIIIADEICDSSYKHYNFFKTLEISTKNWIQAAKFSKKNKKNLIFDVLGKTSLNIAEKCNAKIVKIHSTDIYNYPLHNMINKSKIKNVILSVSGCKYQEILSAVRRLYNKNVIIMFGYQIYPTKSNNLNLIKIKELKKKYKFLKFGYADHSPNGIFETIYNCSSAISMGTSVIEKHFTYNKNIKIEDDESAITLKDFNQLITTTKLCEKNLGKNFLELDKYEKKYRNNVSRSIFASKNIPKNSKISFKNIMLKRTKNFNTLDLLSALKMRAKINITKGKLLKKNYLKES